MRWTTGPTAALGVCLLAGVLLRWVNLGEPSLWLDEGYTWWMMRLDLGAMVDVLRHDVGSPLLYLLAGGWSAVFGDSEWALRAPHALCGSAALLIFALLAGRILRRPWAAVAAVGWVAVSYLLVAHAREARYYAIASLVAAVSLYALAAHLRRPGRRWLALLVTANVVGLYAQNVMGFYLIGLDIAWLLWPGVQTPRRRLFELGIVNALIGLAFAPWLPVVGEQLRWMDAHFWARRPDGWVLGDALGRLLGPTWWHTGRWLHQMGLGAIADNHGGTLLALALGAILLGMGFWAALRPTARRGAEFPDEQGSWRYPLGLLIYALLPVGLIYLRSILGKPMFYERLFVPSCLAVPLLLVWPLDRLRSRVALAIAVTAFALILRLMLYAVSSHLPTGIAEDWRGAYAYLAEHPAGRRLIVFVTAEAQLPFDYYAQRDSLGRLAGVGRTGLPGGFFDIDPPQNVRQVRSFDDAAALREALTSGRYDEVALVLSHQSYVDRAGYGITTADRYGRSVGAWLSADGRIEIVRYVPR